MRSRHLLPAHVAPPRPPRPPGDPWGASAAPMLSGCSALSLAHVCESVLITVCVIY